MDLWPFTFPRWRPQWLGLADAILYKEIQRTKYDYFNVFFGVLDWNQVNLF